MATEDDRYRQSTQFRLWSFSPAQLAELRATTNSLARQNISERLASSTASSSSTVVSANPSGSNTPVPGATPATDPTQVSAAAAPADAPTESTSSINKAPLPEFLTPAEEEQLLRCFTVECLRAAEFCNLPTEIRATSAIFLRRFFVTHSIMTYPPQKMLKTCLFFGSKAENSYPRVNSFADMFPNTTGEEILAGEFLLCQGLRFAFDVRHPYRALEGAIMQLRSFGDVDETKIARAQARGRDILKFSPLVTDAYFHYTPSQIMLAALSMADHDLFERLMQAMFPHQPNGESNPTKAQLFGQTAKEKTVSAVMSCKDMLSQEPPERMATFWDKPEEVNPFMKPFIRKLKKCRDPDRFDLVGLHKKRLEFKEGEKKPSKGVVEDDGAVFSGSNGVGRGDADRDAKRRKVAEDPFGPPL
ncbi:cyclin ccl1 [Diaporthe helianthi]|uniref:RNA polymerase II holoenzyme cyclin-like subunit n=1 Tax=Diaporthe helianthi TaxID=158607 RepID=A0A2P5HM50_DIAHE|nr:cyclin ccl1 [Diaporthe helianthi]